ncbi:MAG: hypothetical protein GY705_08900 [Bacteroidetes bacterium]|nr:hypothetical protein [Bacteroidota bacterium]
MTLENFPGFINNHSLLYQISYQELKSLVLQYPYCQNLRNLLLIKSKMEGNKDYERNLQLAATYSIDRPFLYQLIHHSEENQKSDPFISKESETLDLTDLTFEPREKELLSLVSNEEKIIPSTPKQIIPERTEDDLDLSGLENIYSLPNHSEEIAEKPTEVFPDIDDLKIEEEKAAPPVFVIEEDIVNNLIASEHISESFFQPFDIPEEIIVEYLPLPKSSFSSWKKKTENTRSILDYDTLNIPKKKKAFSARELEKYLLRKQKKKKKRKKKKKPIVNMADQSLQEAGDIASETLAELLVLQEQYEKAIKTYERLILIFPEKSAYFAGKLEKLKNI